MICPICDAEGKTIRDSLRFRKDDGLYVIIPIAIDYCDKCKWVSIYDVGLIRELTYEKLISELEKEIDCL